jgi:hypothetical protein
MTPELLAAVLVSSSSTSSGGGSADSLYTGLSIHLPQVKLLFFVIPFLSFLTLSFVKTDQSTPVSQNGEDANYSSFSLWVDWAEETRCPPFFYVSSLTFVWVYGAGEGYSAM